MALTQDDRNRARRNAENRYISEGNTASTSEEMQRDPVFHSIYCGELAFVENEIINREREQQRIASEQRSDSARSPCQSDSEATTVPCGFTSLTVNKVGDSNRVYRSIGSDDPILELVAGHTSAKATIENVLTGLGIYNCAAHNNRVWNVSPQVNPSDLTNNTRLNLDLLWRGDRSTLGFFNHSVVPTTYRISANTHNNSKNIEVRIYPDHAWEGSITVAFRVEETTRRLLYDGAGIQLSRTDDGVTTQFGGRLNEVLEMLSRYLNLIFEIKNITETVAAGAVQWSLVPPSFTIALNTKWQENTTNLNCGYYYNGRIAFDPLVGIQMVINLGIIAIQAIPYIGRLVAQMAADEITRYVAITFTLQGTLGVDVSFSKNSTDDTGTITGGATGRISFDFQIRAQFNRNLYFIAINCGIRGGARGSVTSTIRGPQIDRSGSYVNLDANFDGLTLYIAAYGRAGASQTTQQTTPRNGIVGDYNNPESTYQVRDERHQVAGETRTEEAGASAEETYPWVDPRPLGSTRFNL